LTWTEQGRVTDRGTLHR